MYLVWIFFIAALVLADDRCYITWLRIDLIAFGGHGRGSVLKARGELSIYIRISVYMASAAVQPPRRVCSL